MGNRKELENLKKGKMELTQPVDSSSDPQGSENTNKGPKCCHQGLPRQHLHIVDDSISSNGQKSCISSSETGLTGKLSKSVPCNTNHAQMGLSLDNSPASGLQCTGHDSSVMTSTALTSTPVDIAAHTIGNTCQPIAVSESSQNPTSIAQRLSEVLQGRGIGDLLVQQTERENGMLQWLQALDLQVMGACRADERLRPMLQLNVSCSVADDKLLAQLSQHFKARELGMLARCLCVPLVSIRVGKVLKQGRLFSPNTTRNIVVYFKGWPVEREGIPTKVRSLIRGHLSLTLLPSSDLRLSFVGDDGSVERLAILSASTENANVSIEEISADTSGRSFLIRLPGGKVSFFWQSEKSKLVGDELLSKMKDLLGQRPSLAQLTGIRESRLDSFATYLRTTFLGTPNSSSQQGLSLQQSSSSSSPRHASRVNMNEASSSSSSNPSAHSVRTSQRFKLATSHTGSQCSLSPRGSNFKDAPSRNVSSVRTVTSAREKIKRFMDSSSGFSIINTEASIIEPPLFNLENLKNRTSESGVFELPAPVSSIYSGEKIDGRSAVNVRQPEGLLHLPFSGDLIFPSLQSHLRVGEPSISPLAAVSLPPAPRLPLGDSPIFSPYYCPCPLRASTLQYTVTTPFLPSLSTETVSLPPASPFYSVGSSASFIPPLPLDLHNVSYSPLSLPVSSLVNVPASLQTSDLPSFLSDPVVNVPLPVSSFVTVPTPQNISSFTPFFSDPIVHIPVLDFHASGPGYLVSAGPTISTAISPILPGLLSTLIPETGSDDVKEDAHAMQLLASLDFSFPWRKSESDIASPSTTTSSFAENSSEASVQSALRREAFLTDNLSKLDLNHNACYDAPTQHKGQVSNELPYILNESSLPCFDNVEQNVKSNFVGLVTGSRGLYGGPCDPIVSSSLVAGARQRSTIADTTRNIFGKTSTSIVSDIDRFSQLDGTASEGEYPSDTIEHLISKNSKK